MVQWLQSRDAFMASAIVVSIALARVKHFGSSSTPSVEALRCGLHSSAFSFGLGDYRASCCQIDFFSLHTGVKYHISIGDSRVIMGSKDNNDTIEAIQLTVDFEA